MTNYSEDEPILKYEHVDISYAGKKVVSDVSFTLHKGEIMGLVGESGSGKSTIIKAAMNLLGMNVGPLRMPLSEIEPEHKARLAAAMKAYGLKLAE